MERGNLVIYDLEGAIISQTGEASGAVLPHKYPVGIPFLEIPYGTMRTKKLIRIDVEKNPHEPVFEDLPKIQTPEERIMELEAELLKFKQLSNEG